MDLAALFDRKLKNRGGGGRPMSRVSAAVLCSAAPLAVLLAAAAPAFAAPPGEVTGVLIGTSSQITWSPTAGSDDYNVYRGLIDWRRTGNGAECHGDEIAGTSFTSAADPPLGQGYFYLVTAESTLNGEGTAGTGSGNVPRPLRGTCDRVVRHHLLDRLGFGGDEWTRGRIATLGLQGYIDEQLAPGTIDETTNTDLQTRLAPLVPPDNLAELQAIDIVDAVYARRQLEEQATLFWTNHFNTDYQESNDFFGFYNALFPATQELESSKLHD